MNFKNVAHRSKQDMSDFDALKPCEGSIRICLVNEEIASMVKQCMDVDDELQPARISKTTTLDGNFMIM